jgi:phosphohistidine phosphatase
MNLYIMQHGPTLPQAVKASQPLSPVGRDQMAAIARAMRVMGLWFDALLASPAAPAVETAQIIAAGLGYASSSVTIFQPLSARTSLKACLDGLRECERFQSVLMVGELPLLADVASHLLSSGPRLALAMEGSALMAISAANLATRGGTLRWLMQGPQMQMIASS